MKTKLLVVGKTNDKNITKGIDDYVGRVKHYMPFDIEVIPELKNTKSLTQSNQKEMEAEQILKRLQPSDIMFEFIQDKNLTRSIEFARWIEKLQQTARSLVFIIGGPYGFADSVYERSNAKLSLSKMTFSHQMIRLLFVEQIYRACTIIKGEPYHHE